MSRPHTVAGGPPRGQVRVALAALVGLLATVTLGAGCSRLGASGPCGRAERQKAQFPATHVLPGQPEPAYLSDPPTSGPHAPLKSVPPVFTEPVPRPTQVGILERGIVLVQYRPDLPAADRRQLVDLAGPDVSVAPNPDLPAPVVASAWLYLLRCEAVDTAALRNFVQERTGEAPGGH